MPTTSQVPFVGRETEVALLSKSLDRAKQGRGSAWALVGPGGIGKTRVLRALEQEAGREGLRVRWGYCLKESLSPFFPFEQIFRGSSEGPSDPLPAPGVSEAGATVIFEEDRPKRLMERALALARGGHPLLCISRDRGSVLRTRLPGLPESAQFVWLTRVEDPEAIAPGALDALGERVDNFLQHHPGGVVALSGLEYLSSQNDFRSVLRLVQMVRDVAGSGQGRFLLSVNTAALDDRQRSLLEGEGEVVHEAAETAPVVPKGEEPPALRLLRFLEQLQADARRSPLLIVLDDLQWADAQSRVAFEFLARNARDLPVMFLVGLREESDGQRAVPGEDSLQEMLDHLEREGLLQQLRLKGITAGNAEELVAGLVGAPMTDGAGDRALLDLVARTEGNPYFLLETLRQLLDQGLLRKEGSRAVFSVPGHEAPSDRGTRDEARRIPLPPTIHRLVSRRLEGLPKELSELLEVAAVVGSEFDLAPVAAALHRTLPDVESSVNLLVDRYRMLQPSPTAGRWEFGHPLVWEVLREKLPKAQERALARILAPWWEQHRPNEVETRSRLLYLARDREGLLALLPRALDLALAARAADTVLRYVRWRQELLTDSPEDLRLRAELEIPLLLRLNREGNGPTARMLSTELRALSLPPPVRWEAALAHTNVISDIDTAAAFSVLDELEEDLRAAPGPVSPEIRTRLALGRSILALNGGAWADGLRHAMSVASIASQTTPFTQVQLLLARAWCLQSMGEVARGLSVLEEARALLTPDMPAEARTRFCNAEGALRFRQSDLRGAYAAFEEAARAAHAGGYMHFEILFRGNLGNVLWTLGEYERALEELNAGLSLSSKFNFERGTALLQRVSGGVLKDLGRLEEATVLIERSRDYYIRAKNAMIVEECDESLAGVRGLRGDAAGAVRDLEALEPEARKVIAETFPEFLLERARFRRVSGDLEGATRDLDEAERSPARYRESSLFLAKMELERAEVDLAAGRPDSGKQGMARALEKFRALGVVRYRGASTAPPSEGAENPSGT